MSEQDARARDLINRHRSMDSLAVYCVELEARWKAAITFIENAHAILEGGDPDLMLDAIRRMGPLPKEGSDG